MNGEHRAVTPCAGVWIEIFIGYQHSTMIYVTPCAGVWIEITPASNPYEKTPVTPCAGVWIEIGKGACVQLTYLSLPVRECGLKLIPPVIIWY